jgi:uridylate kinase
MRVSVPKRVVLKISGEALGGKAHAGLDLEAVDAIASAVGRGRAAGAQIAIVTGAGNFIRGATLERAGMGRERADLMGMAGTVINALALADRLETAGVPARVCSAVRVGEAVEPFEQRRAIEHL